MLFSALLPEFVYGNGVFSYHQWLGATLVVIGSLTLVVAVATLAMPRLRRLWPAPVIAVAGAGVITAWVILDTTSDLGGTDVDLGIWVALSGCFTAAAGGVVALRGLRSREDPSSSRSAPPTTLTRVVGHGALASAGTMLAACFAVRFMGQHQAVVDPTVAWAFLFPGFVGVAAGILTLRRGWSPPVGPALVAGVGASAVWGLWEMPILWKDFGTDALDSGFFLEIVGQIGLVTAGVLALAVLRREHGLALTSPAWRPLALTGPIALAAAVPFLLVAQSSWDSSEKGWAFHDLQMAVSVVAVPVLAAMVRPADLGRMVLLGWALGATGTALAYWSLLARNGLALVGIPYVLPALAVLVIAALLVRPRQPVADPSSG
jgi:hypothetical protein